MWEWIKEKVKGFFRGFADAMECVGEFICAVGEGIGDSFSSIGDSCGGGDSGGGDGGGCGGGD